MNELKYIELAKKWIEKYNQEFRKMDDTSDSEISYFSHFLINNYSIYLSYYIDNGDLLMNIYKNKKSVCFLIDTDISKLFLKIDDIVMPLNMKRKLKMKLL